MGVVLFIGVAATTALFGTERTIHAVKDNQTSKIINEYANKNVKDAQDVLLAQRDRTAKSFDDLAELKIRVLNNTVQEFLQTFEQIKNVDFTESEGLDELKNLKVTREDFKELKELQNFAATLSEGAVAGAAGGALTAFGAWGAAQTFAAASTGTAISSLSGAAASNATLAFFGGGSLATGGLGMAGGAVVLGGLVVGPALAVMGLITAASAGKQLDDALANKEKSDEIAESLATSSVKCAAIRRRAYLFYNLLAYGDSHLQALNWKMKNIIETEGDDYRNYQPESKKIIAMTASTAVTIKAILDTPILNKDGAITEESDEISTRISQLIYKNDRLS